MHIRLNKYLAEKGLASRRKADEYIERGFIKVNNKVVTLLGTKVDPGTDHIEIDPRLHEEKNAFAYYAFHKPVGYVCSTGEHEGPSIFELLEKIPENIFPIGRLDKETSGLLLLTNDGRFAYQVIDPRFEKEKEYIVKTRENLTPDVLERLGESIFIRGKKTMPARIILQSPHIMRVILTEGRNRQIRRLCQHAGIHIERLKRIRIGALALSTLKPKEYRRLGKSEMSMLLTTPIFEPEFQVMQEKDM